MSPQKMFFDVLRIFEQFLGCFGPLWTAKSVIFGPKKPHFLTSFGHKSLTNGGQKVPNVIKPSQNDCNASANVVS
jgi:hypothetical protein